MLFECAEQLPWWGEPWVLLAESALAMGDDDAHHLAEKGLSLLREMGAAWDTRSSFEEWASRAHRVLDQTTDS